jgi:hypothetical protein
LLGPSHFFGRNISAQRAKYLGFFGKVPKFGMKNGGKVAGKQLQRTRQATSFPGPGGEVARPENFFPKKLSTGGGCCCPKSLKKFAPGPRQALGGPAPTPKQLTVKEGKETSKPKGPVTLLRSY